MIGNELIYLNNFNLSIFRKNGNTYVYVYNVNYFCILNFSINIKIKLINQKCIELRYNNPQVYSINKNVKRFLDQFFLYKFTKINFTGKGYKIKKNTQKSMVLIFNRSHMTTIWWNNLFIKKFKKYKFYLKYTDINCFLVNKILNVRYINIFTKKGLRSSRQILLKKKGKK